MREAGRRAQIGSARRVNRARPPGVSDLLLQAPIETDVALGLGAPAANTGSSASLADTGAVVTGRPAAVSSRASWRHGCRSAAALPKWVEERLTRAGRLSLVDGVDDRYRLTADATRSALGGRRCLRLDCGEEVRAPWRRTSFCAISTWPGIGRIFNG